MLKGAKSIVFPCSFALWMLATFFCFSFLYSFHEAYQDNVCETNSKMAATFDVFQTICLNITNKDKYQTVLQVVNDKCTKLEHFLHKDPRRTAAVDTIKQVFGICLTPDCESVMGGISYLMELIIIIAVIIIVCIMACGCQLIRIGKQKIQAKDLPIGGNVYTQKKNI